MEILGFVLQYKKAEVKEMEVYDLKRKIILILIAASLIFVTGSVMAFKGGANPKDLGEVYVTSQGLYYKTFVSQAPLRYNGHNDDSFQELYDGMTDYGPGDSGYRGGRWWIDDGDGIMEYEDTFVLCPLIGPGHE
jgi:hypothetical protein